MPTSISEAARRRLRDRLLARASTEGFDDIGITGPSDMMEPATRLARFIELGRHGDMDWLRDRADWRGDPASLWPEVRSIIMLATSFAPPVDPLDGLSRTDRGAVSVYAARRDYHDVVKGRLKQLGQSLLADARQVGAPAEIKVFVDTAPVMEKPLAARAGLGWQGKHTNLVSRRHGSWTFLGAIFTTLDLPKDAPSGDHCGSCRRCLDICPTAAFPAPYQLDATRCIAYLTVEHQGQIPDRFRTAIGNRIFGCDDCLAVCPWNRFATESRDARLEMREDLHLAPLAELLTLDDAAFRKRFAGTPVKRLGRARFLRNVLVAAGNANDQDLLQQVRSLLADESPLVRGMAVWALGRLGDATLFRLEAQSRQGAETDAGVRSEWDAGLKRLA